MIDVLVFQASVAFRYYFSGVLFKTLHISVKAHYSLYRYQVILERETFLLCTYFLSECYS